MMVVVSQILFVLEIARAPSKEPRTVSPQVTWFIQVMLPSG